MNKRLLIGLLSLVYLFFCSSGFAYLHVDSQQQAIHFTHQDGHSDEYHSNVPGKSAIKAFFTKQSVKHKAFVSDAFSINAGNLVRGNSFALKFLPSKSAIPIQEERFLYHCSFLL